MHSDMAARAAMAATPDTGLESAICFARVCHVEVRIVSYDMLLGLWRAGHPHALEASDGAEESLWPAYPLLAVLHRPVDGAPACLFIACELLTASRETRWAVVRMAADLSARTEVGGQKGRVQVSALLAAPGVRFVEQYPRPRLLPS
jgi:hypothetical protein